MNCHNCGEILIKTTDPRFPTGVSCSTCHGLMYPNVQSSELAGEYGEDYFNGAEYIGYEESKSVAKRNFQRKINILKNVLGSSIAQERILEIGCATGEFLKLCRANGAKDFLGIEISEYCRKIGGQNGFNMISSEAPNLLEAIATFRPTMIVAWDVWEHLYDPVQIFHETLQKCTEVKVVALTTVRVDSWNAGFRKEKWRLFHPPTHISYPTKKSFEIFFNREGFQPKYEKYFGYYRPLIEYFVAVLPFLKKSLVRLKFLYRIPLFLNLFDIQMVVAVRSNHKCGQ